MTDYRTGDEPLNEEQKMTEDTKEIVDSIVNPTDDSEPQSETQETASETQEQQQAQPQAGVPNPLQDIETAVLLVVNSHGNVLPVVQIENLDMKRTATPREVYRICLDAADQLSSVSILGEMTQIYSTIAKEQGKLIAENMAKLLIAAQKNKAEE
jgi:hypothetical protein